MVKKIFTWNKAKETDMQHFKNHFEALQREKNQFESERRKPLEELVSRMKYFVEEKKYNRFGSDNYITEKNFIRIIEENMPELLEVLQEYKEKTYE